MKRQILPLLTLILLPFCASAQTIGDYRSNAASFNWDVDASWLRWDGGSWVVPTQGYPGETATSIAGTVTILAGHTVNANVNVTANDIGNLILAGSAILNYSNGVEIQATGNLTMDGTSQIKGTNTNRVLRIAGSFNVPVAATNARIELITLHTGTTTINGSLTLTTTGIDWNIGTVGAVRNLVIQGAGILNMNADTQDIDVSGNLTMDGTSQIQGNNSNRRIDVTGTFFVPATATNARVAGITLAVGPPVTANPDATLHVTPNPTPIAAVIAGTITFTSDTGVKTFVGRVTVSGSWTSTAITSNNRLVFIGEIITSGVFACGCN